MRQKYDENITKSASVMISSKYPIIIRAATTSCGYLADSAIPIVALRGKEGEDYEVRAP